MARTPREQIATIAEQLSGAEGGEVDPDRVRDWLDDQPNKSLARRLLIHASEPRPMSAHRIAAAEQCEETLAWDAVHWVLATRHNLLECRLQQITETVLAEERQLSDRVELRNGRWVEEETGLLSEVRKLAKKTDKTLERAENELAALHEHINASEIIYDKLRDSELGECQYWIGEIRHTLESMKKVSGKTLVVPGWEVWAASLAAQLWYSCGGKVSVWRKQEPHGVSQFQRFALAWLRLLGASDPQAAIRAMYDNGKQEPGPETTAAG